MGEAVMRARPQRCKVVAFCLLPHDGRRARSLDSRRGDPRCKHFVAGWDTRCFSMRGLPSYVGLANQAL